MLKIFLILVKTFFVLFLGKTPSFFLTSLLSRVTILPSLTKEVLGRPHASCSFSFSRHSELEIISGICEVIAAAIISRLELLNTNEEITKQGRFLWVERSVKG